MAKSNAVQKVEGLPTVESDRELGYLYADQCRELIERGAATQAELARELGVSPAKLGEYYKRRYNQVSNDTRRKFDEQVGAVLQRRTLQERINRKRLYIETSHAERLVSYLDHCYEYSNMLIIRAGTGMGKTHTCKRYKEQHGNVYLMTCKSSRSYGKAWLADLYKTVFGKKMNYRKSFVVAEDEITDELRHKSALLIFDDAHKLSIKTLDAICELYDECDKLGVVLLDQSDAMDSPGYNRSIEFERNPQILRRIKGKPWSLEFPIQRSDVEAFCQHFGVASPDVVDWLASVVNLPETRYDWLSEMVVNAAETFRDRPEFLNYVETYQGLHKKLRRGE